MATSETTTAPVVPDAQSDAERASDDETQEEAPQKKLRMSFQDTVTIVVGPEKRRFIAPKNVLCRYSPFFRAALSGSWSETSPGGCLEMPDDDGDTFTAYLQWTVSGEVVVYEYEARSSNLNIHYVKLFDLYVFADKVGDRKLQNTVIDQLHELFEDFEKLPGRTETLRHMSRIPEHCMLYEYLVNQYALTFRSDCWDVNVVEAWPAFFAKVLSAMAAKRDSDRSECDWNSLKSWTDSRQYHLDDEETPACE
ncbi:hypothetical protein MBLNU457_4470t1 [Dothideomycetes sp. NU457]